MACSVSGSVRTVLLPKIEPGQIDPNGAAYPYPPLIRVSDPIETSIDILVLENDFIRAEIAPSLGGRLLSLHLKSDSEGSGVPGLALNQGGRRGLTSPFGIQLHLDGEERRDGLGVLDASTRVSDELDSAEITLGSVGDWPLSFHLTYSISSDRAEIEVEARVFNRSLAPTNYNAGLLGSRLVKSGEHLSVDGAIAIFSNDLVVQEGRMSRFAIDRKIAPHQLDSWTATLFPITRAECLIAEGLQVSFEEAGLRFRASRDWRGLKVILFTSQEETLDATISLTPGDEINIPLPSDFLPLKGLVILSENRKEILRWPIAPAFDQNVFEPDETQFPSLRDSEPEIREKGFSMGCRYLAHYLLGLKALESGDFKTADFEFEQSLLFNGEDHLAWWLKALSVRSDDSEASDGAEILNAHYLAPLEPALRVEAFLSQPIQPGNEVNPILAPLLDNPDAVLDVASHLIEAGLLQEAASLLGEVLRAVSSPMLHYLLSYCLMKGTKMKIEAAEQLRLAALVPVQPPFPLRHLEHEALDHLKSFWPDDETLAKYYRLSQARREFLFEESVKG